MAGIVDDVHAGVDLADQLGELRLPLAIAREAEVDDV